jgi:hypothetical protein
MLIIGILSFAINLSIIAGVEFMMALIFSFVFGSEIDKLRRIITRR